MSTTDTTMGGLQNAQSPSQTNTTSASVAQMNAAAAGDSLVCQWTACGERLPTAELLYDHVCERHVGRKSTNNLSLTCQWGSCRTTTVKRDHITSHIRVHVPLKPHKCDFCGKAFKRPQDLKKHVKTHADDSVLIRSPEPGRGGQGYQSSNNKLVADLQSLAATASGYYPDQHHLGGQPVYYQQAGGNPSAYHAPGTTTQSSAYGPVYYAINQPQNLNAEYEIRKKAAFDALNEFFGDAKDRRIDPSTYYDVGHRLALQNTPILAGFGGGADYSGGAGVAAASHYVPQYSLPLPNLRTKNDLLSIDQFLDQLQQTVYETPSQAAAAGVAVPGIHAVHSGVGYRTSNSPPHLSSGHSHLSSHAGTMSSAGTTESPALTPASSTLSYTTGHSPSSVVSHNTVSPVQRPNMYPTLPSVAGMAEGNAIPTGLGSGFEQDLRRRYSGGQLQQPAPSGDAMDVDDTPSPRAENGESSTPKAGSAKLPQLDPALRSPSALSEASSEYADKTQELWVENIRTIEALRQFVKEKLERGDYLQDDAAGGASADIPHTKTEDSEAQSLYPVLKELGK